MRKIFTMLICVSMLTVLFTACDKNNEKEKESSSSNVVVEKNFSTDELTEAVKSAGEWPKMVKIEDNDMAEEFFKLDLENENYVEISILQSPMSASLAEIIIINPADGKLDTAKEDLETRKEKLITTDAFYPDHKNIANESIIGEAGGYVYLIVGLDAEDGEKALKNKLNG